MTGVSVLLVVVIFAAYGLASVLYLRLLSARSEASVRQARVALLVAICLHFLAIAIGSAHSEHLPLTNTWESLLLTAWLLAVVCLVADWRWRLSTLGALAVPIGTLALVVAIAASGQPLEGDRALWNDPVLATHVIFSLLGYAALILAFCASIIYLAQDRLLKDKQLVGISRHLPSVQSADEAAYWLVAFGFPLLSLGLFLGMVFLQQTRGMLWNWDPKLIWSLVTWLVFAAYLHARMVAGWKGRRTAALLVVGFLCLAVTYVVVSAATSSWHNQPFTGVSVVPR